MSSHESADPMKFSRVTYKKEPFERTGTKRRPVLKSGEEKFHKIDCHHHPETQQFLARILERFVNVSDIVKIGRSWYSYEPTISKIEQTNSNRQIFLDMLILDMIFKDPDHRFNSKIDDFNNMKHEQERYMVYDFEQAYSTFWWGENPLDVTFLRRTYEDILEETSPSDVRANTEKLQKMLNYFESTDGRQQVEAAFTATGKTMTESFAVGRGEIKSFDDFYKLLIDRIRRMHSVSEEVMRAQL